MKTLLVILALSFAISANARGGSTHSTSHSGKVPHATKATRAYSSGKSIAGLVNSAFHTSSAHVTHATRGGNHGHKSH